MSINMDSAQILILKDIFSNVYAISAMGLVPPSEFGKVERKKKNEDFNTKIK